VTVGARAELATTTVRVRGARLHRPPDEIDAVKLRYRSAPVRCSLRGEEVALNEPAHGVAPGQAAVFLRDDVVVGCATIAR
jgi:tRNA-uridine 2-sulfurtransferase